MHQFYLTAVCNNEVQTFGTNVCVCVYICNNERNVPRYLIVITKFWAFICIYVGFSHVLYVVA